jgi:hypothetical protein
MQIHELFVAFLKIYTPILFTKKQMGKVADPDTTGIKNGN